MRRILYITNGIKGSGGLERVLSVKIKGLINNYNYTIGLIALNEDKEQPFYTFPGELSIFNIQTGESRFYFKSYIGEIKKIIAEFNPDIISVCDDGIKGLFLPLILRKYKLVYERHASKDINFRNPGNLGSKSLKFIMNFGASLYEKFVVLTESNKVEWNSKNLIAIPNPLSFYPPELKTSIKNNKVIFVGSHSYIKGLDRLLNIWGQVYLQNSAWYLEIFGKKDKEGKFIQLAKNLNIESSVKFYDPVIDIQSKYLEASIFAMASRSEGFGMVIIEAMACGLPCIVYDCPSGPRDIITDGVDGFLIPDGNQELFIEKLHLLMNNPELRYKMGRMARRKAAKFKPENIIPQWDQLFKSL